MSDFLHLSFHCRILIGLSLLVVGGACRSESSFRTFLVSDESAETSLAADEPVDSVRLKDALLPLEGDHPLRLSFHEDRVTTTHEGVRIRHELELELRATLSKTGLNQAGHVLARLSLDRIELRFGMLEPEKTMLSYDSEKDDRNQDQPLAELMQVVAGCELELAVSPEGKLVHLAGLDTRWRRAGILMAPPALMQAQWLFRDIPMQYLLAEALFPVLPEEPMGMNDTVSSQEMIHVPLVSRLTGETRNTLREIVAFRQNDTTRMRYILRRESTFRPAKPILEGRPPSLATEVRDGTQSGTLEVIPDSGDMTYAFKRRLELAVYQVPPEGDRSPPMTIEHTVAVEVKRGREATKRVP